MLLSCGHKKQNSSQELSTLSTSEKGLKNFSQAQFEIQLIPPMQPGRAWKRKIQLTNHPFGQKSLRVEKKDFVSNEWIPQPSTNPQGVFIDESIEQDCQYRFNQQVSSPVYEGVKDVFLKDVYDSNGAKLQKIKAYRILIPEGDRVILNGKSLELLSSILILDGEIVSFENPPENGETGGNLLVYSQYIYGKGEVRLTGARGVKGAQGAQASIPTEPGKEGYKGGDGGEGGHINLKYVYKIELNSNHLQSNGGPGGDGGDGGNGFSTNNKTLKLIHPAMSGQKGPNGNAGANGIISIEQISELPNQKEALFQKSKN
jgi:hypothetical protein